MGLVQICKKKKNCYRFKIVALIFGGFELGERWEVCCWAFGLVWFQPWPVGCTCFFIERKIIAFLPDGVKISLSTNIFLLQTSDRHP